VTNAVVAKAVVLSPAVWVMPVVPVGKDGDPVKAGLASGASPSVANDLFFQRSVEDS
jgi:hypothetical protein